MTLPISVFEALKKHNIELFSLEREDLFTFALVTEKPVDLEVLDDVRHAIGDNFGVRNKVAFLSDNVTVNTVGFLKHEEKIEDAVTHPSHYNQGRIEVIEAIEDWRLDFHRGNAVKYIARAGRKDPLKEIEDLKKAIWYIERAIEVLQSSESGKTPCKPNNMKDKK
jgi:hypothetical protein